MSFQYKLKYYKDEEGEYTDISSCDKGLIETIILEHWTGEQLPNGLELIIVTVDNKESIILEHSGKDVFEVYFLRPNENFLFHKKSRIDLIHNTLSTFMDKDFSSIESNLNKTRKENRLIRKLIISKDFKYQVRSQRLWTQLYQILIFGIPLGLTFSITSVVSLTKLPSGTIMDILIPFVFIMGFILWVPGLIIHYQYKKDNEKFSIRLTKGANIINVEIDGLKKELLKDNISTITVINNPWYKIPWSEYGHTEIKFNNGDIINLTNLIIDQFVMMDKFPKHALITKESIYPTIKQRTSIK